MRTRDWFYIVILLIAGTAYCIDDLSVSIPLAIVSLALIGVTELLVRLADRYV